jgi:hypothetical protein
MGYSQQIALEEEEAYKMDMLELHGDDWQDWLDDPLDGDDDSSLSFEDEVMDDIQLAHENQEIRQLIRPRYQE